jgi:glycosyltransferase involved in cell wall biosynthesis
MSNPEQPFRWIVAQEGSRRNYSMPVGFNRLGLLRQLYTDIWCRRGASALKKGPRLARALAGRHHAEIPSARVVSFFTGAILRKTSGMARQTRGSREAVGHVWCDYGAWFAGRLRRHLETIELDPRQDAFFGFDTGCLEALQLLRERGIPCIVNQVDPGRFEEEIVLAEYERWPGWGLSCGRLPQRYWDRLKAEWDTANFVCVNSDWSRSALVQQGVPADKILVTPLAVDLKGRFKIIDRSVRSGPLRVLWLGSVNLRKGFPYLIEAARMLRHTNMEFLAVGELEISENIIQSFPGSVRIRGPLPRVEVPAMYAKADVFVLPTLSDGFGVTQLEAMSQGLPVIATANCGRVVSHGVDGWIIPPRDSYALADALTRLNDDRVLLREMSRQAQLTVRRFDIPANVTTILAEFMARNQNGAGFTGKLDTLTPSPPGRRETYAVSVPRQSFANKPAADTESAVLCHAGHRDLYHVAWALREAGLLKTLVTDLYFDPKFEPWLRGPAKIWPKFKNYSCAGLRRADVHLTWPATLRALALKRWPSRKRQVVHDQEIGRTARRLAEETGSNLFSYSYYACAAFAPGPALPVNRILFQLHPHPLSARKLLREELERVPEAVASLKWEHEVGSTEQHFENLCREPLLATGWMAASSFTARTLADHGVPRECIHVVPYGVDPDDFPTRQAPPPRNGPLRLVWVGNLVQRKGLTYLLDAMANFAARDVELVICTHHPIEAALVRRRNLANVKVLVGLSNEELIAQLHGADLFVLPALLEGFAAVILEAMSCGLPVLTTPNTCGPDVLEEGVTGFIVPIRDAAAIAQRVEWSIANRDALFNMGQAAARSARLFSWHKFRSGVVAAYRGIVRKDAAASILNGRLEQAFA